MSVRHSGPGCGGRECPWSRQRSCRRRAGVAFFGVTAGKDHHCRLPTRGVQKPDRASGTTRFAAGSCYCTPRAGRTSTKHSAADSGNRNSLYAGTNRKPSDGLEPSTPSLPYTCARNQRQPAATVLACLSRFRTGPPCHRLPPFAPALLHKCSTIRRSECGIARLRHSDGRPRIGVRSVSAPRLASSSNAVNDV